MRAIILAAGRGSRMKGLTEDKPKCLLSFRDKTLLSWQLASIQAGGIQKIAVVTGYKRECLNGYGLIEFFNPRWAETNMVASLTCAREWLLSEPCLVSYSDIFYLSDAVKLLANSSYPMAITYDPKWLELWSARFQDPLEDAETFRLKKDNTLIEIGGKPKTVAEIQGQYMGLLRFTPESWVEFERLYEDLDSKVRDSIHMTGMLQLFIRQGKIPVVALPYLSEWYEFDSDTDLNARRQERLRWL